MLELIFSSVPQALICFFDEVIFGRKKGKMTVEEASRRENTQIERKNLDDQPAIGKVSSWMHTREKKNNRKLKTRMRHYEGDSKCLKKLYFAIDKTKNYKMN